MEQTNLYSMHSANCLLGSLFNNPKLLLGGKFNLDGEDFSPCKFHRILFWCIRNLLAKGVTEIDEIAIDSFLQGYEEYLEVCNDNDFLETVPNLKQIALEGTVEYYYDTVKKFSLLRYYKENGFDIKDFFDETKEYDKQLGILEKYSIEEIINYYKGVNATADTRFNDKIKLNEIKAGETFQNVKEEFKITPYFGANLQSLYQTALYRGWCKGHLLLRSAPSGHGKSMIAVGDLCSVCATEYWDEEAKSFVPNPSCEYEGGLYINTEMDLDTEVQPMFIAWISGVPRSTIMDGEYTEEEEERLDYATKILLDSNIYLVDDPKFTLFSLENTIKENAINKNVGYVVIDYFQDNGIIGKEMSKTHSIIARDTIILNLADESKKWARDYNVGILAMTQLNGNEKINEIIDESCLAGGRAVKNKIDAGCIMLYPRKKELNLTEGLLDKKGFGDRLKPNAVIHNYKVRFGKYGTNVKLFQNIDLGTGRIIDMYATDVLNNPLNIEIIKKVTETE